MDQETQEFGLTLFWFVVRSEVKDFEPYAHPSLLWYKFLVKGRVCGIQTSSRDMTRNIFLVMAQLQMPFIGYKIY